jgi:hypothetical protein
MFSSRTDEHGFAPAQGTLKSGDLRSLFRRCGDRFGPGCHEILLSAHKRYNCTCLQYRTVAQECSNDARAELQ